MCELFLVTSSFSSSGPMSLDLQTDLDRCVLSSLSCRPVVTELSVVASIYSTLNVQMGTVRKVLSLACPSIT